MSDLNFEDFDKYLLNQNGRIIHQIWFGTIPNKRTARKTYQKMKLYRDSWKIHNPTWCHIEWDKDMCKQLVSECFSEHADMFGRYKYEIQRCDTIRYLILYRYGGWYADMDYYCNRPVDEALEKFTNDIYFVQSPNSTIGQDKDHISNSLMYSIPKHKFWKKLMIELEMGQKVPYYYPKHVEVMFTTGPGILNRVYSKYKFKYRVKSLPHKLFHPFGIKDDKMSLSGNNEVYAVHVGKGSWENNDSKFLLTLVREWKFMLFVIIVMILPVIYNRVKG